MRIARFGIHKLNCELAKLRIAKAANCEVYQIPVVQYIARAEDINIPHSGPPEYHIFIAESGLKFETNIQISHEPFDRFWFVVRFWKAETKPVKV